MNIYNNNMSSDFCMGVVSHPPANFLRFCRNHELILYIYILSQINYNIATTNIDVDVTGKEE